MRATPWGVGAHAPRRTALRIRTPRPPVATGGCPAETSPRTTRGGEPRGLRSSVRPDNDAERAGEFFRCARAGVGRVSVTGLEIHDRARARRARHATAEGLSRGRNQVASHDDTTQKTWDELPFGALEVPPGYIAPKPKAPEPRTQFAPIPVEPQAAPSAQRSAGEHKDWRPQESRRGSARRGGRRRQRGDREQQGDQGPSAANEQGHAAAPSDAPDRNGAQTQREASAEDHAGSGAEAAHSNGNAQAFEQRGPDSGRPEWGQGRRRRRRGRRGHGDFQRDQAPGGQQGAPRAEFNDPARSGEALAPGADAPTTEEGTDVARGAPAEAQRDQGQRREWRDRRGGQRERSNEPRERNDTQVLSGMFLSEHGGFGVLRRQEAQYLPSKEDIWVPQHLVQRFKLRDGSIITGPCGRGTQHKFQLNNVDNVDGKDPREVMGLVAFKKLTSIDPDFHYQVGDVSGDVSMRILDVLCPVGRGSRGLIVAPPRSGKTILMRKFAAAIEQGYPDVKLMVLLVDERPEEATEWKRSTKGEVYVSTNDEQTKNHVQIAEVVWHRCQR